MFQHTERSIHVTSRNLSSLIQGKSDKYHTHGPDGLATDTEVIELSNFTNALKTDVKILTETLDFALGDLTEMADRLALLNATDDIKSDGDHDHPDLYEKVREL